MTVLGVFLSAGKKKKMQVYSELYEFNEKLILNLKFNKVSAESVAEGFKFIPAILSGEKVLDGQDGETVDEYFSNLGKSDAISQIDYLNGRKDLLAKRREESVSEYKKYGSLYVKIFFMVGVLMAVLLA